MLENTILIPKKLNFLPEKNKKQIQYMFKYLKLKTLLFYSILLITACSKTNNAVNRTFTPQITPTSTNFRISTNDTAIITISNALRVNDTYSLQYDSAFTYNGISYPKGGYVKLKRLIGNNNMDTIVFTSNVAGQFKPIFTIKNSLPDSNTTFKKVQLNLNVYLNLTLLGPASGAINQPVQPIFIWTNAYPNPAIASYAIYYGTNVNSLVQDTKNYTVNTKTSDTIRISPNGGTASPYLEYNQKYYWKVLAINANGVAIDSANDSFTVRPAINLNTPRMALGLVEYNNLLYAVGGGSSNSDALGDVETFDGSIWKKSITSLPTPRLALSTAVYNGLLYTVAGLNNKSQPTNTVETFDGTNWTTATGNAVLPKATFGASFAVYNSLLYAVAANIVATWDGTNWTTATGSAALPTAGNFSALATYNGLLYSIGGFDNNGNDLSTVNVWNGTSWRNSSPLLLPTFGLGTAIYDGKLYAIGGLNMALNPFNEVEIWDGTNWKQGTPMPTARAYIGEATYNNLIYAVGGLTTGPKGPAVALSIVEIYNPATNQWQ